MTETRKTALLKATNIFLTCVIVLLVAILIMLIFFFSPLTVEGESMEKSLHDGDKIIIQKNFYSLNYGDTIVFDRVTSTGSHKNVIKRLIGKGGDTITFKEGAYYRNGEKINEDYLDGLVYSEMYLNSSEVKDLLVGDGIVLNENELFVLGDNRNISIDSHIYGCITISQVKGKVVHIY